MSVLNVCFKSVLKEQPKLSVKVFGDTNSIGSKSPAGRPGRGKWQDHHKMKQRVQRCQLPWQRSDAALLARRANMSDIWYARSCFLRGTLKCRFARVEKCFGVHTPC
jgi:hypothetical protein